MDSKGCKDLENDICYKLRLGSGDRILIRKIINKRNNESEKREQNNNEIIKLRKESDLDKVTVEELLSPSPYWTHLLSKINWGEYGVETAYDLKTFRDEDLLKIPGIGPVLLKEIKRCLENFTSKSKIVDIKRRSHGNDNKRSMQRKK